MPSPTKARKDWKASYSLIVCWTFAKDQVRFFMTKNLVSFLLSVKTLWVFALCLSMATLMACSDPVDNPGGNADVGVDSEPSEDVADDTTDPGEDVEQPDDVSRPDVETPDADLDGGPEEDVTPPPDTDTGPGDDTGDDTGDEQPVVLSITSINPGRGPVAGGTPFVITGTGFTNRTTVFFGARQAQANLVEGNLVGQSPASTGIGPVVVKVLDPERGQDSVTDGFVYTAALEVDSVFPNRVPTTGGVEVTIRGSGFTQDTYFSFGGATGQRHTLIDSTQMRVIVPPRAAGRVDVRGTNPEATTLLAGALTYFNTLSLDAVRPATGSVLGSETVTLSGSGFSLGMSVNFGNAPATVVAVSADGLEATVTTPAHGAGLVHVVVANADDAFLLEDAYYYTATADEFAVAAVTPSVGPASGGTEVTLIGAGLDADGLQVFFGEQAATIVARGPGFVVVQIPGQAPGTVDVRAQDGQGSVSTLDGGFTYVADLWVDGVTPETGDAAGGYEVEIRGEGFTGASAVYFGAIPAAFTVTSDARITATAPAQAAGAVDVRVERGGIAATLFRGFTYTDELAIWGFFPVRGSIAGNTYVEIRGKGFHGTPQVRFGAEAGTNVQVLDAHTLSVRTPAQPSGSVDLVVSVGAQSVTADSPYTYFNPGSRSGGTWGGPIQGAVNVTVYSYFGQPIEGAFVMLSTNANTPYYGLTDAEGMITLSGPDVYGEQTITAAAAEHSSTTVQRVNAENVTIFLLPQDDGDGEMPPGPPLATFQGRIQGLNKIAEPGPRERLMAIVYTTQVNPWRRNPNPGAGHVVESDGPYTLRSRLGDVALIAVGGLYNNQTNTFRPLRMGVERYLFAADGQTYRVDIELDIELNQSVSFKLDNPPRLPGGPNGNLVRPFLDFGFEGVFGELEVVTGRDSVLEARTQPRLAGKLADVSYLVIGGAYTDQQYAPLSEGILRGVTDTSGLVALPPLPGIPVVTSPPEFGRPIQGLVEFVVDSPNSPDIIMVYVLTPQFDIVWEVYLPGSARSFRFPDFPDMSHLPPDERPFPYPGGTYILYMVGLKSTGISYDNFSYDLFGQGAVEASSVNFHIITF
jgi:hypothetical protein